MGALLKFVLIAFCVLYLMKIFGRFLVRGLLSLVGRQMAKNMEQYQRDQSDQQTSHRSEGEITITRHDKKGRDADGLGEYVDFEEVKD